MARNKRVDLSTVVVRSSGVITSDIDGEVVMMSVRHGSYSALDIIGSEIWELMERPRRISEICDILMDRYQVDRRQCETDILAYLNDLASDETIRVMPADG